MEWQTPGKACSTVFHCFVVCTLPKKRVDVGLREANGRRRRERGRKGKASERRASSDRVRERERERDRAASVVLFLLTW